MRAVWLEKGKEVEGTIPENWKKGNVVYWPNFLNVKKAALQGKNQKKICVSFLW